MTTNQNPALEHRVELLESHMKEVLHHLKWQEQTSVTQKPVRKKPVASKLQQIKTAQAPQPLPTEKGTAIRQSPVKPSTTTQISTWFSSENWLNKIGIGLLLFGLIFLFKFSIDQGWLTPVIRVGIGLMLGATLLGSGSLLKANRQALKSVLFGGGIATLYISIYAAFQFYQLIPHIVTFIFMVLVSLLSFFLALRGKNFVLALIGTIGGLITPLLLQTDDGTIFGLIGYTCLVLFGTIGIYFYTGWRTLLAVSTLGGWLILIVGWVNMDSSSDIIAVQVGILFAWVLFWGIPTIRDWLVAHSPQRWQPLMNQPLPKDFGVFVDFYHQVQPHLLVWTIPFLTQIALGQIDYFEWESPVWGIMTLGFALIYAVVAYFLHSLPKTKELAVSHILVAAIFAGIGWLLIFAENQVNIAFLLIIAEGVILQFVALKMTSNYLRMSTIIFWGLIGIALLSRFAGSSPLFGDGLTNLIAIATIFAVSFYAVFSNLGVLFRVAAHILFLGWIWHVMGSQTNGAAATSAFWGIYAIVLLMVALVQRLPTLRGVAMATIFLVVAKLFVVDLVEVPAFLRILLFMGFGVVFLVLSYFLPKMTGSLGETES